MIASAALAAVEGAGYVAVFFLDWIASFAGWINGGLESFFDWADGLSGWIEDFIPNQWMGIIMLACLFGAIVVGFPIAQTLIIMAFLFGFLGRGSVAFNAFASQSYTTMTDVTLAAVPMFLLMGYVLEQAGLMDRLFRALQLSMANLRGSLYLAVIAAATIFAAATGIVGASVTLIGLMAIPSMTRSGYDVRLSAGAITAGGTLGILIPPSIMLVVMAPVVGVKVLDLFAAAIIPGVMLSILYTGYAMYRSYKNPELGPPLPEDEHAESVGEIVKEIGIGIIPPMVLITATLGSILWGWATPTEASAMGAMGAIVLALLGSKIPGLIWRWFLRTPPGSVLHKALGPPLVAVGNVLKAAGSAIAPVLGIVWQGVRLVFKYIGMAFSLVFRVVGMAGSALGAGLRAIGKGLAPVGNFIKSNAVLAPIWKALTPAYMFMTTWLRPPEEEEAAFAAKKEEALQESADLPDVAPEPVAVAAPAAATIRSEGQRLWKVTRRSLVATLETGTMIMILIVASNIFGSIFSQLGSAKFVADGLVELSLSPLFMLLLILVFIFVLGWPLEWVPIVLIFVPILLPVVKELDLGFTDYDGLVANPGLVWFSILVAVTLQTAWLSPPVALSAYFLKGVAPHWDLKDIYAGMFQFMGLQLLGLILVLTFKDLALWLPEWFASRSADAAVVASG